METVGNEPVLRFEARPAGEMPSYPIDETPTPVKGWTFIQTRITDTGSYDQVRRHLFRGRQAARETFIPLDHPPGRRAEADFGHIHVDFPDGRRLVPVLIVTWSYSNAPFAVALPTERAEAVLQGLCDAFDFFGCKSPRYSVSSGMR